MNENKLNWNKDEFKTYLLLYAANADFKLQDEEKQLIAARISGAACKHIEKQFEKDNDFVRLETLLSYREKFFPTEQGAENLLKEISEMLFADDKYCCNEENFFKMLKKILMKK